MNKQELIEELINIGGCDAEDEWSKGYDKGVDNAITLCNQLDEPELPVIPQFVADYIEAEKKDPYPTLANAYNDSIYIGEVSGWLEHYNDSDFITDYAKADKNQILFARAWFGGYTIEKKPIYYVILAENEDKEKGQALYKDFNFNGDKVVSTHIETFSKRVALEAGNFQFTEQEIKAIDERYWAFAEEVPNV